MNLESARFEAVRARVAEVAARAKELYGVDLSAAPVSFNLRGRVAGWAGCKICAGQRQVFFRFNRELIAGKHFDDILNETVPHELAHGVTYLRPELGRKHDAGWKRVCMALGGTGKTRHDYDVVVKGRWDYLTDRGNKVSVSKRYHEMVQQGQTLRFRKGLGSISQSSPCAPSGQLKVSPKSDGTVVVRVEPTTAPKTDIRLAPKTDIRKAPKTNIRAGTEVSWASKVRLLIKQAKAVGSDQATVVALAVGMGMKKTSAINCVKANWSKV